MQSSSNFCSVFLSFSPRILFLVTLCLSVCRSSIISQSNYESAGLCVLFFCGYDTFRVLRTVGHLANFSLL